MIGVAMSPDLKQWKGHLEPLISYLDTPYDNLYVSGAVVTDEGRVAIMFSAQKFPELAGVHVSHGGPSDGSISFSIRTTQSTNIRRMRTSLILFALMDYRTRYLLLLRWIYAGAAAGTRRRPRIFTL